MVVECWRMSCSSILYRTAAYWSITRCDILHDGNAQVNKHQPVFLRKNGVTSFYTCVQLTTLYCCMDDTSGSQKHCLKPHVKSIYNNVESLKKYWLKKQKSVIRCSLWGSSTQWSQYRLRICFIPNSFSLGGRLKMNGKIGHFFTRQKNP